MRSGTDTCDARLINSAFGEPAISSQSRVDHRIEDPYMSWSTQKEIDAIYI